jgi:hypothetical protein
LQDLILFFKIPTSKRQFINRNVWNSAQQM